MDNQSFEQALGDLDGELLDLLQRRFRLARDVMDAGTEDSAGFFDPVRVRARLRELCRRAEPPLTAEVVAAVHREIESGILALRRPTRVAFLGPEGTFTHQAALNTFGHAVQYEAQSTIADVFDTVARRTVEYGVVPVENSTEGAVTYTLDMFIEHDVHICAEVNLSIHHHLLAHCARDEIETLFSHPQVFGQCRRWLREHLPDTSLVDVASTTEAAVRCSRTPRSAALAGALAADLHRLPILAENVEDFSHNTTRFLVLGHDDTTPSGDDRTSILFVVRDRVGALYDSLQPLGAHGVSMSFIESRPSKRRSWEYVFFVDILGHVSDPKVRAALDELAEHCQFVKVMGSYPRAVPPE